MKYDICVFGGCSLDQTYFQKLDGSYNDIPDIISPGGKGANQAVAAAKAGAKTTIITRIGKDKIGKEILDNLNYFNIDTSNVEEIENLENDYSNIYINIKDKDNEIKRFSGAINSFTVDMIDQYKDIILNSKIIVCQLKIPKEVTIELINFCYKNNKILILTPCRPEKLSIDDKENIDLINKISYITCNRKEFETIFKSDDIEYWLKKYPNKLIVTLGAEGLIYFNGERFVRMPAIDTSVIDTTGAGDTLCGNLSAFLAQGMSLKHSLRKAMYASAMKLQHKTAQSGMPYLEDLEIFIRNKRHYKFSYSNELNFSLDLVKKAYELIKYGNHYNVSIKDDDTLVTEADKILDKYIIEQIREKFPNDNFLTEETYFNNKLSSRTWIVDPIDGTAHFIKKDGFWGIQLAFYDKEETKFSIIYLPEKDELYYAAKDMGAFVNNKKIFLSDSIPIEQSVIEFGGSLYKEKETKQMCYNNLLKNNKLLVSNLLHINSACVSYTNLVSGKTDALIISTNKYWDIMPGEFLCQECGIKIYYLDETKKVKLLTRNKEILDIIYN